MSIKHDSDKIPMGDFPYPIIKGPVESEYLTWVRNHSNYMLESGITDFLRIAAVLVRGIFMNLLIMLPYFLVVSVLISLMHVYLAQPNSISFGLENAVEGDEWEIGETATLEITTESNFVETTTITIEVTRPGTPQEVSAFMQDLHRQLVWASGQFDEVKWTLDDNVIFASEYEDDGQAYITSQDVFEGTQIALTSRSPFFFSSIVLGFSLLAVLSFPVGIRMSRVKRYRMALKTGQLSSVKRRDLFERLFGSLLLVVIAVAALENLPRLIVAFHALRQGDVTIALPTLGVMVGGMIGGNQLLPILRGWAKKLAMLVIGLLGLLIPLVLILFVVEFLVYTDKSELRNSDYDLYVLIVLIVLPAIFAVLLAATAIMGFGSFKWKGRLQLFLLFASMIVLIIGLVAGAVMVEEYFPNFLFTFYTLAIALEIWVYCWLAVDVNQTSINGLYRDRLASAYLVGVNTDGEIDIEQDLNLQEICNYDARSTAPYHLINTALNLQGSTDPSLRDRKSDFFVFSKRFCGGDRTGYCRSENMESVFPQMDLGTAMAISAAAAAPNMGAGTNRLMTAFLTLLNIRLGFWVPNPDRLEQYLFEPTPVQKEHRKLGFYDVVFRDELDEIRKRRALVYPNRKDQGLADSQSPTVEHGMVGLAFSGGGIRSGTVNLGIVQALHRAGVFRHVDYMSSVSGGGYLASSISTLMRHKVSPYADFDGTVELPANKDPITVELHGEDNRSMEYYYAPTARMIPQITQKMHRDPNATVTVEEGDRLLARAGPPDRDRFVSLMDSFSWRIRPSALRREMMSKLDERHYWVNLSDGGHIENMATIELLRRRCKYIILGDGEGDPNHHFNGLATLQRYAKIDLGIEIKIDLSQLRLDANGRCQNHYAVGTIHYPDDKAHGGLEDEVGYLLYLKSSITGDEDELITEYRGRNKLFPHESTADQLFDEGQFEAYRALGQHIGEQALQPSAKADDEDGLDYNDLKRWFEDELWGTKAP